MGTDGGGTVDESVRRQPGSVRNARVSLTAGGVLVLLLCGAAVLVERSVEAEDVADGASPHPVPVGLLVPIGVVAAIGLAEIALAVLLRPGGRITRTLTYVVCGIVLLGCSAPLSLSLPTGEYSLTASAYGYADADAMHCAAAEHFLAVHRHRRILLFS